MSTHSTTHYHHCHHLHRNHLHRHHPHRGHHHQQQNYYHNSLDKPARLIIRLLFGFVSDSEAQQK